MRSLSIETVEIHFFRNVVYWDKEHDFLCITSLFFQYKDTMCKDTKHTVLFRRSHDYSSFLIYFTFLIESITVVCVKVIITSCSHYLDELVWWNRIRKYRHVSIVDNVYYSNVLCKSTHSILLMIYS